MGQCCGTNLKEEKNTNNDENNKLASSYQQSSTAVTDLEENIIQKFKEDIINLLIEEKESKINDVEIGDWLIDFSCNFNKKIPIYIIFNMDNELLVEECINCCNNAKIHWKRIIDLLHKTVPTSKDEPISKVFKTIDDCMEYINEIKESIISEKSDSNELILNNTIIENYIKNNQVNFYENSIKPYIIYKKLKIKYDFYYIPLHIYNAIKVQTNIIKTIQVLELLGCDRISINITEISNNQTNIIGKINTGFITTDMSISTNNENFTEIKRGASYEYLEHVFTSEESLLSYTNLQSHIFMDIEDYHSDIELKYLIRARIKSYLNSYSRSFHIKKLSSIEAKLQAKMSKLYNDIGLDFSYNDQKYEENNIILNVTFFNLESITNINNLPLTAIGFKIISDRFKGDGDQVTDTENSITNYIKEINRFFEKILKTEYDKFIQNTTIESKCRFNNSYMKYHFELKKKNIAYLRLTESIDTFNDIINLLNIIKYSCYFTPVNKDGFEMMVYKSLYPLTNFTIYEGGTSNDNIDTHINSLILEYYYEYFKRFAILNNISESDYDLYVSSLKTDQQEILFKNIENFDSIRELLINLFLDPRFTPINKDHINRITYKISLENDKTKKREGYYLLYYRIFKEHIDSINYTRDIDYKLIIMEKIEDNLIENNIIDYDIISNDIKQIIEFDSENNNEEIISELVHEIIENIVEQLDEINNI